MEASHGRTWSNLPSIQGKFLEIELAIFLLTVSAALFSLDSHRRWAMKEMRAAAQRKFSMSIHFEEPCTRKSFHCRSWCMRLAGESAEHSSLPCAWHRWMNRSGDVIGMTRDPGLRHLLRHVVNWLLRMCGRKAKALLSADWIKNWKSFDLLTLKYTVRS